MINSLDTENLTVAIIGLGYVGLPLALSFCANGVNVIGVDKSPKKIELLNSYQSDISHIDSATLKSFIGKNFRCTLSFSSIVDADAVIICVPTPLGKNNEPDLKFVIDSAEEASTFLKKGCVVSLESTTWPGTTDEIIVPILEAAGHAVGTDVHVVYSPEREDPGNKHFSSGQIPKLIGGVSQECLRKGLLIYQKAVANMIPVESTKVAEMAKLLENIYRSVNIGLINEMKIVADKMGVDIFKVIDAAATKPFGFVPFYPGPGLGGHCIPIDPFYLSWKAKEFGVSTRFIELAGEINRSMPHYTYTEALDLLNLDKKPVSGSKILVIGVAYKPDIDDMRESPSIDLIKILISKGADVSYHDPFIPEVTNVRNFEGSLASVELTTANLVSQDLVIISTNHTKIDYGLVRRNSKRILDTRGALRHLN